MIRYLQLIRTQVGAGGHQVTLQSLFVMTLAFSVQFALIATRNPVAAIVGAWLLFPTLLACAGYWFHGRPGIAVGVTTGIVATCVAARVLTVLLKHLRGGTAAATLCAAVLLMIIFGVAHVIAKRDEASLDQ